MEFLNIYATLFKSYGPQLWWPVTEEGKTMPAYTGGPKNDKQMLEVAIGAVLAQNTNWKNSEKAIINLNSQNLINIKEIEKIGTKELENIIKPSGFYSQKAQRLKLLANFLESRNFDLIKRGDLLEIKGIGPETADSILLYACGKPEFVVDSYTKRVFSRLGLIETNDYDEIKGIFQSNLSGDPKIFQEFHALIVEHAKRFCRKEPICEGCPLNLRCNYYKGKCNNIP